MMAIINNILLNILCICIYIYIFVVVVVVVVEYSSQSELSGLEGIIHFALAD